MGHVHDFLAPPGAEEADVVHRAVAVGIEVGGDLAAVGEFLRGGDDGGDGELDTGHVVEEFLDLAALPFQLGGVGEVLILAAAALAKEGAARLDAVGRGAEDGGEVALAEVFVVPVDAGADEFAGQGKGDHDDPAVETTEALPHVGEGGDFQVYLLMVGEGVRMEFPRGTGGGHADLPRRREVPSRRKVPMEKTKRVPKMPAL